ncbi:PQQ-like beta-propeller repeat protein [bacterium]|nr:PQQ-like beta-propeller repeat protein [bacterium]
MTKRLTVLLILILMAAQATQIFADDWPRWRGAHANQISTETGWNANALSKPTIVWESQIGRGHSAFAIAGGQLFTTGQREVAMAVDTVFEEIVFSIDAITGKENWRHTYRCPGTGNFPGPESTPCIDKNRVYTIGREGDLFCLNREDGRVLWHRNVVQDSLTRLHAWGISGSPIVDSDMLFLNIGESGAAFDKKTGSIIWGSKPVTCGFASPVLFVHEARSLVAMQAAQNLNIVSRNDGKVVWEYKWSSYQDPIVMGDNLFLTAGQGGKIKGSAMLSWTDNEPTVLWNRKRPGSGFQNWVVIGDYGYGFFNPRKQSLQCINLKTGDLAWEEDLGDWGSFIAVNDKLIIATGQGEAITAEATPEGFRPISRAMVLPSGRGRQDQCYLWTHPILADGLLYIRNTDGDMVCIDMRAD